MLCAPPRRPARRLCISWMQLVPATWVERQHLELRQGVVVVGAVEKDPVEPDISIGTASAAVHVARDMADERKAEVFDIYEPGVHIGVQTMAAVETMEDIKTKARVSKDSSRDVGAGTDIGMLITEDSETGVDMQTVRDERDIYVRTKEAARRVFTSACRPWPET